MSWTVACFCGTVFRTPPDRCPTCNTHVDDPHPPGPIPRPLARREQER